MNIYKKINFYLMLYLILFYDMIVFLCYALALFTFILDNTIYFPHNVPLFF